MAPETRFNFILGRVGRLAQFEAFKLKLLLKGHYMDPITAIFTFLSSEQGQVIVALIIEADKSIVTAIAGLIKKIHDKPDAAAKGS